MQLFDYELNNCYHNDNGELQQELYADALNLLKNLQISLLAIVRTTEGGAHPPGFTMKIKQGGKQ